MRTALAFLCQIAVILLTAGLLFLLILFAAMGGGAVVHVNPIALAVWIGLDASLIYASIRLNRKVEKLDPLPEGEGGARERSEVGG